MLKTRSPLSVWRRLCALPLLLALAFATAAHAATVSFNEIAIDPPVDLVGDALHGLTLRKTVLLMRHGVRPPTSTPKFQVYANAPFPTWDVPDGDLTGHGATLIGELGAVERIVYAIEGILPQSGCPRAGDLFVWADNADERTEATGDALVGGLFPGCGLVSSHSSSAVADPLFSPAFPQNAAALKQAVLDHVGNLATLQAQFAPLLTQLGSVLGCCSTTVCKSQAGLSACSFDQIPWTLTTSGSTVTLGGPPSLGSSIAEIFELEYANGFTGANVAFGRASTQAAVTQLMALYTGKYRAFDRTPALARANGSDITRQMLDAVESGAGETVSGGPPEARMTVFVGHDSTLSAVGGMLGMDWHAPSFLTDDMPPGGGLGFELLSDQTGNFFVRPVYITENLAQMHSGPITLASLPSYQGVVLPGCDLQGGRLCRLKTFETLLGTAIDPASTAPESYN